VTGSTTTVYVFSGNKVIAEYDNGAAVGSPSREYIYAGAALLAKIDSSGTKYYHQDHLSNRLVTDSSGNALAQLGHFPFGESWYNASNDKLLFTACERDSESGNDFAMARYYVNRLGRFNSVDPLSGAIGNPQSLNAYAYVANDPINFVDPTGMGGNQANCRVTIIVDGIDTPCWLFQQLLAGNELQICLDAACTIMGDVVPALGGAEVTVTIGMAIPAYPCPYGDCQVSPQWLETDATLILGWFAIPTNPDTPQDNPYIKAIAQRLRPLIKLSDCTGNAALKNVPFSDKILGTEPDHDPVGKVLDTAEKLSDNKVPAKIVWGVNKAGLPALSETVENGLTPVVSKLAPFAGLIKGANLTYIGIKGAVDTATCYNKPD